MAFALGSALHKSDVEIVEIYGRNTEKAVELARVLKSDPVSKIESLSNSVDAYLLLVSDDAIAELSSKLPVNVPHIHTSGATNIDVLESTVAGVVWPIKSINPKSATDGFKGVPVGIEGNTEAFTSELMALVNGIGASGVEAKSSERSTIHLAAVFTDNFANHCLALSQQILSEANLDTGLMRELASSMAKGAIDGDSFARQTGVALRGDQGSQQKHIRLLKDESLKEFYKYLSSHIAKHHEL